MGVMLVFTLALHSLAIAISLKGKRQDNHRDIKMNRGLSPSLEGRKGWV
jgi:hypothetical protein